MAHCQQKRLADHALDAAAGSGTVPCQVVAGLGGVGKTQLAAGLARRLWNRGDLDLLVWVSATSRSAMVTAYTQAAADVTGADDSNPDQATDRFLAWLATTTCRWLIVLDDLTDPNDLRGLWPPPSRSGRTVVTTRNTDSALAAGRQIINLGIFTPTESMNYLTEKLADPGRLGQAAGLADDLGHLPLALAQAATYILDRANMTCGDYRRRFADRRRELTALAPRALPDDYPYTVATTWSLSIGRADTFSPPGVARPVLELAALLDPNGIPAAVLTTRAVLSHLGARIGSPVEDDDVMDALNNLARLSLTTTDPATGNFRVHGLLQRVVREAIPTDHIAPLAITAADALDAIWPQYERDREHAQSLRANTTALYTHTGSLLWTHGAYAVLLSHGVSLGKTGQAATAAAYFDALHSTAIRYLGHDHSDTLIIRGNSARLRGEAGDAARAVRAFEELLTDQLRVLGPDHPDTLRTRHYVAHWYGDAGDAAGAVTAYENLLPEILRVLGPDHPDTLNARYNLARWRGETGDATGAVTACEKLLADSSAVFGPDHPQTLLTRINLAFWRGEAGDAAGAATAYDELLPNLVRVLGPHHPHTLLAGSNHARWRGETGDATGAVTAYEKLHADSSAVLGPDHPQTLSIRGHLAHWRGGAGDAAGAAAEFEELLPEVLRVSGPDHPQTFGIRFNMAYWRGEAGDAAGAATACEGLLPDLLHVYDPDHPRVLATRSRLAECLDQMGNHAGAIAAYQELLTDARRVLGPEHPNTLMTRTNLAILRWQHEAKGEETATPADLELLADLERLCGPDFVNTLNTRVLQAQWRKQGTP
ncbi:tetratricopeptide repeat protein [Micromonospora sp. CA-248260]|uniref:tetratricopeptide repeat protein n=1 Tax=Micromonospora sp. CA-248260 TaxID=3239962 RepID=UPI003D923773